MVDVEKELGHLFDKLDNKEKLREEEYQRSREKLQAEQNEFNELANTMIEPVMREYQTYLQKRHIMVDIIREPKPGRELLGNPSIKFDLMDPNMLSRNATYPSLKFSLVEGSIHVVTEGKKTLVDRHSEDQINQELVKSKLTDLVKSCYDVEPTK